MCNMNSVENERMLAFAKEYAELCRKHGLYLVFNDDVRWIANRVTLNAVTRIVN